MNKTTDNTAGVIQAYRHRAKRYDFTMSLFNLFSRFGFDLEGWRSEAVQALALKRGDTVVDIGCGTGLNFSLLEQVIGPEGKVIGVDLSEAMLAQARQRVAEHDWQNIELVQADAAHFEFPANVDGIVSTYALTLIPDCAQVIRNGSAALAAGRRWVVLDMAWPAGWPEWWRHVLFFLPAYGVTGEVIRRRPWAVVWQTMEQHLSEVTLRKYWMGFFYLVAGRQAKEKDSEAMWRAND